MKGNLPPEDKNLSIDQIKRVYPVQRVLRFYGWDEFMPYNNFHAWCPVRCPFHDDVHMSASLHGEFNRFHCHACDIGGDVIDLVKEVEHLKTIKATLRWIVENVT